MQALQGCRDVATVSRGSKAKSERSNQIGRACVHHEPAGVADKLLESGIQKDVLMSCEL
jgi:hypothetical protein